MPVLMMFAEWRYLKTRDELWKTLAQRWSKVFAVLFAVGAVSGTVLAFELGLLWPEFVGTFGSVIGLPFTLEGFAFFLEAIFVGIYLYAWDRLSPRAHWFAAFPIAVSGAASAWFVVTANAWMNVPRGFELVDGKVTNVDPLAAMLNPATGAQTTHMILAAYMVSGFVIASLYALSKLRRKTDRYHQRAMALGLALGMICAPAQAIVGHWAAQTVAQTQPVKLAAMEGQFQTESYAPLRIGGIPNPHTRETYYAIEIPGGLSWLAFGDSSAVVTGLNDFPTEDTPPVVIVHLSFQVMVAAGAGLVLLSGWAAVSLLCRRRLPRCRAFLWAVACAGPLSIIAMEAGWMVTEIGRQPWIVQGVMRTAEAVTTAPGVGWLLGASLVTYFVLATGTIVVLRLLARVPIGEDSSGG
jgi:cytochrome d ubiquinol oxidase subunit I